MSERKTALKPCEEPGKASVEDGVVLLDGPDGVAVTMTAHAALLTAQSLREAAEQAQGQAGRPPGDDGKKGGA